jgi:hypothetical protein
VGPNNGGQQRESRQASAVRLKGHTARIGSSTPCDGAALAQAQAYGGVFNVSGAAGDSGESCRLSQGRVWEKSAGDSGESCPGRRPAPCRLAPRARRSQ